MLGNFYLNLIVVYIFENSSNYWLRIFIWIRESIGTLIRIYFIILINLFLLFLVICLVWGLGPFCKLSKWHTFFLVSLNCNKKIKNKIWRFFVPCVLCWNLHKTNLGFSGARLSTKSYSFLKSFNQSVAYSSTKLNVRYKVHLSS